MKTLVLCVDRDDDIGDKAGLNGPIVGRESVLEAAIALGIADPEDSDTNTILAGVAMYDDLIRKGIDAEVVVISGDRHVGFTSDQIMITQLENVLAKVEPGSVILVSDGAEDENIYPMISSRTKVDSIRRVIVRQSKSLESLYYMISKSLTETKTRNRIYIPFAMVLLIYGLLVITGYQRFAFAAITLTLGVYLLWITMDMTNRIKRWFQNAKESVFEGRVIVPFTIITLIIFAIGIVSGVRSGGEVEGRLDQIVRGCIVGGAYIVWGLMVFHAGSMIDVFMRGGRLTPSFWFTLTGLAGVGVGAFFGIDWLQTTLDVTKDSVMNYIYTEIAATALLMVSGLVYW
ncbi:MAG TPA: DUF373 family protein, partial [Euryarchaeota archaeon]|nr:DUF373 family protein [Euryarchaeota archaeon]